MRVLLQRVTRAAVRIEGEEVAAIGRGFLLLLGIATTDTPAQVEWLADKVSGIRLFADEDGLMNQDLATAGGALLVISQFTLYGDASRGRRPSFIGAARPEAAVPLYEQFLAALRSRGHDVAHGVFGADMQVNLVNDGPVTLLLEKEAT